MMNRLERISSLKLALINFVSGVLFLLAVRAGSPLQVCFGLLIVLVFFVAIVQMLRAINQLIYEVRLFWKAYNDEPD